MRVNDLVAFIKERHSIWVRRAEGRPKPWTDDPILQKYRFCNVYRELDKETMWIAHNWRTPHQGDQDLWFAMCVARLVNWSPTLTRLGYPVPWKKEKFLRVMDGPGKVWGHAYIVSTNGHTMLKSEYIAEHVLDRLWTARAYLRPRAGDTLAAFHKRLMGINGMGSFMAAQVVADMKYVEPLRSAADWHSWAASGPGSKRGLNRVLGRDKDAPHGGESQWLQRLQELQRQVNPMLEAVAGIDPLHAQDLQNCLCEFDKYERARLGEGKPKSTYPGV